MDSELYAKLTHELKHLVKFSKKNNIETWELVEFLRSDDTKVNIEQLYTLCK